MSNPARLLTTKDVALELCISVRTARLWAECDVLPALRIGRQWRFRARDIESWLLGGSNDAARIKKVLSLGEAPGLTRVSTKALPRRM